MSDSLPPLSKRERIIGLFTMRQMAQMIRLGLKMLGEDAARTLLAFNGPPVHEQ